MGTQTPETSGIGLSARTTPEPNLNPPSSPLLPAPEQLPVANGKLKKKPTVTPRTFTRFFTPRPSIGRGGKISASRKALRDITASAQNRKIFKRQRTSTKDNIQIFVDHDGSFPDEGRKKRRKMSPTPETTPDLSSPLKRISAFPQPLEVDDSSELEEEEHDKVDGQLCSTNQEPRVVRYGMQLGPIGQMLGRELGTICRGRNLYDGYAWNDWQSQTANFVSRPDDSYMCLNVADPTSQSIPFCTASCNTNSLVAIGDEDGGVRLLETAKDLKPVFSAAYLTFRPHTNAILDLAFSHNDMLLATASGDQTAQIIDMPTQRPTYSMTGHVSSVKQVRFQPGSSNIIATSSRDGSVQIWDLRCKGMEGPVRDLRVSLEPSDGHMSSRPAEKMTWVRPVNSIYDAHAGGDAPSLGLSSAAKISGDAPSKTESPGRRGDVSITTLTFLPPGREHLLATASEANASIKLWDLRTTHSHRRNRATPLSTTQQPESHSRHRHFGMTSLALSDDGGRLYGLCRDNTVYAYSTSHLVLGHVPELSSTSSKPRRSGGRERSGIGPIYGFRHRQLHVTTFYVKLAVRSAVEDKSELLAVGSSDGCAILFPTDERYMRRQHSAMRPWNPPMTPVTPTRPPLGRNPSSFTLSTRMNDNIPIYQHGSALVRGHTKEVTSLTWSANGGLVTVGDDFTARCWREGPEARDLRTGGEKEGRRWNSGWAEVEANWDDDDE